MHFLHFLVSGKSAWTTQHFAIVQSAEKRSSDPHQGDYDGSGQQSYKCNYVDFSK